MPHRLVSMLKRLVFPLVLGLSACKPAPQAQPRAAEAPRPASACQRSEPVEAEPVYEAPLAENESPFDPKDSCAVSRGGLTAAAAAALATARPALPVRRWDHKTPPARLALLERRFALTAAEREHLLRDGFVVPERLADTDYALALHEVFQSQLPLFISADAILHAIYASNDKLLARLEGTVLAPRLSRLLEALHCALPAAAPGWPEQVARDVDLYLTVARTLLADKAVASLYGQDPAAAALVAQARAAGELTEQPLFGRARMIDFSLYRPRGHYASAMQEHNPGHLDLAAYFRAVTWLSRLEFNLVSRSCTSSERGPLVRATPREAATAIALGQLVGRAQQTAELDQVERALALLAGRREDVPLPRLAELAAAAGIASLADPQLTQKLGRQIGSGYARTARTHYTWEGCTELPVIATLLGPRIVADTAALRPLLHGETPERHMLQAADVAYTLGHAQALTYLAGDLKKYPELRENLARAQKLARVPPGADLYSAWSAAIRQLAEPAPTGSVLPSFMQTAAFANLRLGSSLAAFGQLRHNNVLLAAQTYDEGGCAIPDAFLDPVPAVYDALIAYAERGAAVLRELDPQDSAEGSRYFARLGGTLKLLAKLARDELYGRPLTPEALRFLGMVVEVTGSGRTTGGSPTFTGWYFDLFRDRRDAFSGAAFIADYYTSSELGAVAYLGVSEVRLGIFVVDTGGEPRVVVGPVARAFSHVGPLAPRLSDAEGARLTAAQREAPWEASYTVAAPKEPPLTFLATANGAPDEHRTQELTLTVFSTRALGPVTIELLDHHRQPLGRLTKSVGVAPTRFHFPARPVPKGSEYFGYEGVHLQVGEFAAWELDARAQAQAGAPRAALRTGDGHAYGGMPPVPPPPPPPEP